MNKAAVTVALQPVHGRDLQRRVLKVVEPVVAQREQHLVGVQPAHLAVALPRTGDTEVEGHHGLGRAQRTCVLVRQQPSDECTGFQTKRAPPELWCTVGQHPHPHRTLRKQRGQVHFGRPGANPAFQQPSGRRPPRLADPTQPLSPVLGTDNDEHIGEAEHRIAAIVPQVVFETPAPGPHARGGPQQRRVLHQVAVRFVLAQPVGEEVVDRVHRQHAVSVAAQSTGAPPANQPREELAQGWPFLRHGALPRPLCFIPWAISSQRAGAPRCPKADAHQGPTSP